jgi:hypothetical protein
MMHSHGRKTRQTEFLLKGFRVQFNSGSLLGTDWATLMES